MRWLRPSRRTPGSAALLATVIVLGLAACSLGPVGSGDGAGTEVTAGPAADMTTLFEADQADIDQARFEQAEGRSRWRTAGPTTYTMTVGYVGVGMIEVAIDDGQTVSTTILAEPGEHKWLSNSGLPSSVAEAFDQLDALIAAAAAPENDPDGDCNARYFTARWDRELGYPTYFDGLGPCEEGVGVSITVSRPDSPSTGDNE